MDNSSDARDSASLRLGKLLARYRLRVERDEDIDQRQLLADLSDAVEELQTHSEHQQPNQSPAASPVNMTVEMNDATIVYSPDAADATDDPTRPLRLPDYELLEEIARGGMGVVFKARQLSLNRTVAIKMILSGELAGREELARFQTEAVAVARLRHPNIVAIYEVGQTGSSPSQHFFSMDYVQGQSLAQLVRDNPLNPNCAAKYLAKIAHAIEYAHNHGILHRDLKPANVLVDADNEPRVTDFGLAKHIEGDSNMTASGSVIGTPSYMPPEQALGKHSQICASSDVYSLGAILYESLTGRPPFRAETVVETLRQVVADEPVSPARLQPRVPRDLETICLKCLQKDRRKRYATAAELAADLECFLAKKPISARPIGVPERLLKWSHRRPAWAALILVSILAAVVLLVGGVWYQTQLHDALGLAEDRLADTRLNAYALQIQKAQDYWNQHPPNIERMRALLEAQRPKDGEEDLRGFEWHHLWHRCHSDKGTIGQHNDILSRQSILTLQYLNSGQLVIAFDKFDTSVEVRNGGKLVRQFTLENSEQKADALDVSGDGARLAVGWRTGDLTLHDFAHPEKPTHTLRAHDGSVASVAFSKDGKLLATGGDDLLVKLWDATTQQLLASVKGRKIKQAMTQLTFSPDGKWLASCNREVAVLYNISKQVVAPNKALSASDVTCVAFSPDSQQLATTDRRGGVTLYPVDGSQESKTYRSPRHTINVASLAFSPDGELIAAGSDNVLVVWNTKSKQEYLYKGHQRTLKRLAFAPNGETVASSSVRGVVKFWEPLTDQRWQSLPTSLASSFVEYSRDGNLLIYGGGEWREKSGGRLVLLDAKSLKERRHFRGDNPFLFANISPNGKYLLAGTAISGAPKLPGHIQLWDTASGAVLERVGIPGDRILNAVFAHDDTLVLACESGCVHLWDRTASRITANLRQNGSPAHERPATLLAISSDADTLVSYGNDLFVRLWDMRTRRQLAALPSDLVIRSIAVSEKAKLAALPSPNPYLAEILRNPNSANRSVAGNWEYHVQLYDIARSKVRAVLGGHTKDLTCMTFSPNGRRLATGSNDGNVKIWDTSTGHELLTLRAHPTGVMGMSFSPDATHLATVGTDAKLRIWMAFDNRATAQAK